MVALGSPEGGGGKKLLAMVKLGSPGGEGGRGSLAG